MIEGLPTEVLQELSEILDNIHPPSLLTFARASKRCYAVASTILYRTVKVTVADGKQRFQHACAARESLRRTYFWWRLGDLKIEADERNTENPKSLAVPRELIQVDGPRVHIPVPIAVIYKEMAGDLSTMRALKLNVPLAPQGLPAPTEFPSLATLTFTCVVTARSTPPEYWDEVTALLRNLPHLTTLQIKCWDRAISFIPSLSPNLRKLDLGTLLVPGSARLRDDHIHQLAEICPNLQHLTTEIRRSRGDAAEVERYRSLGRLSRLQELHIYLDASPPEYLQPTPDGTTITSRDTAIEPWFDEQDTIYLPEPIEAFREGHVRDVLVNSAIDASLALYLQTRWCQAKEITWSGGTVAAGTT
ncbi:hypothetical protein INS49_004106 [Diaporthe citri]|uniref:uncharacterized protein n=1 Tax=Diaporthe citri TaxID=83186 RepID=UPI001C7ECC60|nr:uncharacterized protein INS49_004106 [Diaporthe citri]KAG6355025.1 hypothetical protein INS49_004106 [Diaporthe citri]